MQPLKFGIIGVGGMGGGHAKNLVQMEEAELVAVADVDDETAQRVAGQTGARAFTDGERLIREAGVEAVIIATPHYFHPPLAQCAAQHGVHVLSEKPVGVSVAAADAMIESCKAAGVLLGVMFQQRTEASRRKMKQMLGDGVLGDLHRVSMAVPWYRSQAYYDSGSWRGTWKGEGGGILMNQAPHSLDQFVWLGGVPRTVQGIAGTRLHNVEVETTALSIFDYGDGKVGWLYVSTAEVPGGERIEVAGDQGILLWESGKLRHFVLEGSLAEHLRTSTAMFGSPKGAWHDIEVEKQPAGHTEVVKAFVRAVRENDESLLVATGQDGLAALELGNAMLLAGYTRREVQLPLDRAVFEQMHQQLQAGVPPAELTGA